MDNVLIDGYGGGEDGMNRLKRIADFLEKLAVIGIGLAIYQDNTTGMGWAIFFFLTSLFLTREKK